MPAATCVGFGAKRPLEERGEGLVVDQQDGGPELGEDVGRDHHESRQHAAGDVVECDVDRIEVLGTFLYLVHRPPLGSVPSGEDDAGDDDVRQFLVLAHPIVPGAVGCDQPADNLIDVREVVVPGDLFARVSGHRSPDLGRQLFGRSNRDDARRGGQDEHQHHRPARPNVVPGGEGDCKGDQPAGHATTLAALAGDPAPGEAREQARSRGEVDPGEKGALLFRTHDMFPPKASC